MQVVGQSKMSERKYNPKSLYELCSRKFVECSLFREGIRQVDVPVSIQRDIDIHYDRYKWESKEIIFHELIIKAAESLTFDEPGILIDKDIKFVYQLELCDIPVIPETAIVRVVRYSVFYRGEPLVTNICERCCTFHKCREYATVRREIRTYVCPAYLFVSDILSDANFYCYMCVYRTIFYVEDYAAVDKCDRWIMQDTLLQIEDSETDEDSATPENSDNDFENILEDDWDDILVEIDEQ